MGVSEKVERNALIVERRRQGATLTEIAADFGVTHQRVRQIIFQVNPEANIEAKRVRRMARAEELGCPKCGRSRSSSRVKMCQRCWIAETGVGREEGIRAIREFVRTRGQIPSARDWNTPGRFPSLDNLQKRFGSWNNAIAAAGFVPVPVGIKRGDPAYRALRPDEPTP